MEGEVFGESEYYINRFEKMMVNDLNLYDIVNDREFSANQNWMVNNLYDFYNINCGFKTYQNFSDSDISPALHLHRPRTCWRMEHPIMTTAPSIPVKQQATSQAAHQANDQADQETTDQVTSQEEQQNTGLNAVQTTTNVAVLDELYSDMQLPKPVVPRQAAPTQLDKTTRSAMVQDSGVTLLFNQTLLLLSQLHVWVVYLLGVILPMARNYTTQLAPEAIICNFDILLTFFVRIICYLYSQLKLLIQEELTRWTSLFLCAVWESLMRLSVYR